MRKPWRTSDDAYIASNAGQIPLAEMARHLGRTQGAVRKRACILRKSGAVGTSLRHYEPRTQECPECHKRRSVFYRNGICKVCALEQLVREHKDTAFALWQTLEPEYQSRTLSGSPHALAGHEDILTYVESEPPKHPDTRGMTDYMAAKAMDGYLIALEEYRIGVLQRQICALKGREHRWRKHQKKQVT